MDLSKFKELLDSQVTWPDYYTFKFVVKESGKEEFMKLFSDFEWSERPSRNGKYISLTARKLAQSADEVISIYQKASTVKGVITL